MEKPVLLVGGTSLLGREIRDRYKAAALKGRLIPVAPENESTAVLAAGDDELEVIPALSGDLIADASALVAASSAHQVLERLRAQPDAAVPLFDVTGELFTEPGALLRAPLFESRRVEAPIHVLPHPAAWMMTQFIDTIHQNQRLRRCVATILEPASATGQQGIEELQKQTVALLSFKELPKSVFDAQVTFNLVARFGESSKESIQAREGRIRRDLFAMARLHGHGLPMASVRLIQAGTFHGYGASVWLDFEERPDLTALPKQLIDAGVDVRGDDLDPPTNAGMAGQSGYAVGAIEGDPLDRHAVWAWLAADNLTLQADLVIDLLREVHR
jgi:aspartate-semialdehyde dehydrogenase